MKAKDSTIKPAVCPWCGRTYRAHPATARADGKTLICPECGTREALKSIGVGKDEQEKILATIYQHRA